MGATLIIIIDEENQRKGAKSGRTNEDENALDLNTLKRKLDGEEYEDVALYLDDLNKLWDDAMTCHKSDVSVFKMAKKYKALCLKKFELFFEALTDHRRRSKRLMNGCHDIRRYSHQHRTSHKKT